LPEGKDLSGAVLADQPRSISWERRPIRHAGRAPDIVVTEVRERLGGVVRDREKALSEFRDALALWASCPSGALNSGRASGLFISLVKGDSWLGSSVAGDPGELALQGPRS